MVDIYSGFALAIQHNKSLFILVLTENHYSCSSDVIVKKVADLRDNYFLDEFVRDPVVIRHPGFSVLARRDVMVQNAMARQGLTIELLQGIGRKQFSSRQGIVGGIVNSLGAFRNVRNQMILQS